MVTTYTPFSTQDLKASLTHDIVQNSTGPKLYRIHKSFACTERSEPMTLEVNDTRTDIGVPKCLIVFEDEVKIRHSTIKYKDASGGYSDDYSTFVFVNGNALRIRAIHKFRFAYASLTEEEYDYVMKPSKYATLKEGIVWDLSQILYEQYLASRNLDGPQFKGITIDMTDFVSFLAENFILLDASDESSFKLDYEDKIGLYWNDSWTQFRSKYMPYFATGSYENTESEFGYTVAFQGKPEQAIYTIAGSRLAGHLKTIKTWADILVAGSQPTQISKIRLSSNVSSGVLLRPKGGKMQAVEIKPDEYRDTYPYSPFEDTDGLALITPHIQTVPDILDGMDDKTTWSAMAPYANIEAIESGEFMCVGGMVHNRQFSSGIFQTDNYKKADNFVSRKDMMQRDSSNPLAFYPVIHRLLPSSPKGTMLVRYLKKQQTGDLSYLSTMLTSRSPLELLDENWAKNATLAGTRAMYYFNWNLKNYLFGDSSGEVPDDCKKPLNNLITAIKAVHAAPPTTIGYTTATTRADGQPIEDNATIVAKLRSGSEGSRQAGIKPVTAYLKDGCLSLEGNTDTDETITIDQAKMRELIEELFECLTSCVKRAIVTKVPTSYLDMIRPPGGHVVTRVLWTLLGVSTIPPKGEEEPTDGNNFDLDNAAQKNYVTQSWDQADASKTMLLKAIIYASFRNKSQLVGALTAGCHDAGNSAVKSQAITSTDIEPSRGRDLDPTDEAVLNMYWRIIVAQHAALEIQLRKKSPYAFPDTTENGWDSELGENKFPGLERTLSSDGKEEPGENRNRALVLFAQLDTPTETVEIIQGDGSIEYENRVKATDFPNNTTTGREDYTIPHFDAYWCRCWWENTLKEILRVHRISEVQWPANYGKEYSGGSSTISASRAESAYVSARGHHEIAAVVQTVVPDRKNISADDEFVEEIGEVTWTCTEIAKVESKSSTLFLKNLQINRRLKLAITNASRATGPIVNRDRRDVLTAVWDKLNNAKFGYDPTSTVTETVEAGTEGDGTEEAGTEGAGTEGDGTEQAGTEEAGTEEAGTEEAGTGNKAAENAIINLMLDNIDDTISSWGGGD